MINMNWIYIFKFIGVIVSVTLADICWAQYFIKVSEKKAFKASMWSSAIMVCGLFSLVSYIDDRTLMIAAVMGAFIGTYVSVWYSNKKEDKNEKGITKEK
jgi:peptidoglycan biosynthesis protein MviN/MurJ (putative lipid II flippase)